MLNAISMAGLTKRYGTVEALVDLTLDVPAGTVFGFLGPNGAGKTTALKLIAGLARATGGAATVNGIVVTPAGAHRRQLGYLAQDPRFYGWMTGREISATSPACAISSTGGSRPSPTCSSEWALRTRPIAGRAPIRAACGSAWVSRRPSSASRP